MVNKDRTLGKIAMKNSLASILLIYLTLSRTCCLGSQAEQCEVSSSPVVTGSYKQLSRCSSVHIGEALHLGEGCEPRPTIIRLPWPQNSSHIDQVGD